MTSEEPPKSEPVKTAAAPRSDVDGNGSVDAQDVAWAVYYFNRSWNGAILEASQVKLDLNGDQQFDAADVLFAITDFNAGKLTTEGESSSAEATAREDDALTELLAIDSLTTRKRK